MANTEIKKREFFENLFSTEEDPWYFSWRATQQYRYQTYIQILSPLLKNSGGTAVDIGCALGDFTVKLYETKRFKEVIGIDISQKAVNQAQKRFHALQGLFFIREALPTIPFKKDSLSFISMLEVLYYIPAEERIIALENAYSCLHSRGLIFISVNLGERYFCEEEIKDLVEKSNFKIEIVHLVYGKIYWNFELYPLRWYKILRNYEIEKNKSYFFTKIPIKVIKIVLGSFKLFEWGIRISRKLGENPCLIYIIARKAE